LSIARPPCSDGRISGIIAGSSAPARVVKLVDAGDSKSPAARRAGSIPASGTTYSRRLGVCLLAKPQFCGVGFSAISAAARTMARRVAEPQSPSSHGSHSTLLRGGITLPAATALSPNVQTVICSFTASRSASPSSARGSHCRDGPRSSPSPVMIHGGDFCGTSQSR
jgi:hypothetical protein